MTPERWAQIEELFHRVVECDAAKRTALLDQVSGPDPELRREVEALLCSETSARDHLQNAVHSELHDFSFSLTGKVVSHYRILDALGGGGMGLVYRAEDIKLSRRVALKFLPEESASDPAALARFEREARAASALEHPNICPIYEFGEHEGRSFLVMQLLEGQTLRELLENGKRETSKPDLEKPDSSSASTAGRALPVAQVVDLAIQIAAGLDAAHQKGIIHRDVKPANIFITAQGEAKILDFGLAKLEHGAAQEIDESAPEERYDRNGSGLETALPVRSPDGLLSRTGIAMGTAGYMSPEQARGDRLDARTDLFSFGLVLYEMATGHRGFEGETGPELHRAILSQTPVAAKRLNPAIPPKLAHVITRALIDNRDRRYQTVLEMCADLEVLKREIAPRLPLRWWALASLLVFVLAGVGAFSWFASQYSASGESPTVATFRQLTLNSSENPVASGSISPNGKFLAYGDTQGMHVEDIESGSVQTTAVPWGMESDRTYWEVIDSAWFPDNIHFVANAHPANEGTTGSSRTTDIWVFSREGAAPRKLRENAVAWAVSPDGTSISVGTNPDKIGEREAWIVDSGGKGAHRLFDTDENSAIVMFLWSPDSKWGVYLLSDSAGDGPLLSRDLQGGPPVTLLTRTELKQSRGDFFLLPDGRLVYQVAERGSAADGVRSPQDQCNYWTLPLDLRSGKRIRKPTQLTKWMGFCSFNAGNVTKDGKRLVFIRSAVNWTVNVADLRAGGTRTNNVRHLTLDERPDFLQDWTNDSKEVLFVSNHAGQYGIYSQPLDGGAPRTISTGPGNFRDTQVTPDSKWLLGIFFPNAADVNTQNLLMRIPLSGGAPELVTTMRTGGAIFCARSPSRLCVLFEASEDRRQVITASIDPIKGRGPELARVVVDPASIWTAHLSPDGTRIQVTDLPQGPIRIVSLRGHPDRVIPAQFKTISGDIFWSVDGNGLYVGDQTAAGRVIDYVDLKGHRRVLWTNPAGWSSWARPSPDGHHLAIQSSSVTSNMWMMENF